MVSIVQSVWSLSIGLCYQISHLPEERLWDVVVLALWALRVGQFRDTSVPNGPWKGTAWWWGPNSSSSGVLQEYGYGCLGDVTKVVQKRELEQALVAGGIRGSLLAAVRLGPRLCPASLCWCSQWLSGFAQSLLYSNFIILFFLFYSDRKQNR